MKRGLRMLIGIFIGLLFMLSACSNGAAVTGVEQSGEGVVGPQEIENATEVVKFDPASIPLGGDAVGGECGASSVVPGAYLCALETGEAAEPCFALDGARLLCDPDPVAETYGTLINATNPLPTVIPPPPDRTVVFFVELDDGMTCAIRTAPEPVFVGGIAAGYDCDAPYAYLLGEQEHVFGKDAPVWSAGVYILDPATGESPSGEIPKDVLRAWIP